MNCPSCGAGPIKIIGEQGNIRRFKCPFCFTDGEIDDRVKPAARPPVNSGSAEAGETVYEKNVSGVLRIEIDRGKTIGTGSGFLVGTRGYGITNGHVVNENGRACGGGRVSVLGRWAAFRVVHVFGDDGLNDIALIKLDGMPAGARHVTFGDSEKVKAGQQLFIIGNSLGKGTCLVGANVSDTNRDGMIMTDANANPGNSGSPVFNRTGEVIGVHTAGEFADENASVKAAGMKYAIPINHVKKLISDYERRNVNVVL